MEIKAALQLLELATPFSKAELKKAYRDALMVWHPDRFAGRTELKAKAEGRTYQINDAYALLSRIPESDYPYRTSAGSQQAKQPPPANPQQANAGPPPQAEPPRQQPQSPRPHHNRSRRSALPAHPQLSVLLKMKVCDARQYNQGFPRSARARAWASISLFSWSAEAAFFAASAF